MTSKRRRLTSIRRYYVTSTSVRRNFDVMCPLGISRLRKNGGQRSDLISLLLNSFLLNFAFLLLPIRTHERKFRFLLYNYKKLSEQLHA